MAGIVLLVVIVTTILWPSSSSTFRPSSHWLGKQNTASKDDFSNIARVLRLRGGEETKKDGTDKIKGCCIGIDLGTTYRYGKIYKQLLRYIQTVTHSPTDPNSQLRCRLEERKS